VTGTRSISNSAHAITGDNVVVATTKLSAVRWEDWGSV